MSHIKTQDDKMIDTSQYSDPYVTPNAHTKKWDLEIPHKGTQKVPELIASFEKVEQANEALKSLRVAIASEFGWDANEYKEWASMDPMKKAGYG